MTGVSPWTQVRRRLRAQGPTAARILVIAVLCWQAALWAGADQPPVFAAIVPLLCLRSDSAASLTALLLRILGVMAGVALSVTVVNLFRPTTFVLAVVLGLALLCGTVISSGTTLNVQVAVTSLLVFANPSPESYGFARLWENALGGAITAVLGPVLWPRNPLREAATLARECADDLAEGLVRSTRAIGSPDAARANRTLTQTEVDGLRRHGAEAQEAEKAMRFNPLRRRHRNEVTELGDRIGCAVHAATHLVALAVEVEFYSVRDGPTPVLSRARTRLLPVAEATGRALEALLAGRDPQDDTDAARAELARYAKDDTGPVPVVLRRPFTKILDLCDAARRT
ncbi:FUSC family protein [Streptomyces olivochromogenes]|uniref:FUSC family protein n=1 Tax=Streptomyces olivochromogenes TaxID=1963 RepID=UPI001F1750AA|nr:FUSC family protein [Streptomyces olivochromogenes]MCF3133964.1 FUSC family protein [Streptomyces olivochromogenes]